MQQKAEKKFFSEIIASKLVFVKLSLLKAGYLSSAANVLTSSPKIWHDNKRDFFKHNFIPSDQKIR